MGPDCCGPIAGILGPENLPASPKRIEIVDAVCDRGRVLGHDPEFGVPIEAGISEVGRGDDRCGLAEQVHLGVQVADSAHFGAVPKKRTERLDVADPKGEFVQVESGDDPGALRLQRQQTTERTGLDERADNPQLAVVGAEGALQLLPPPGIDQAEGHDAIPMAARSRFVST